MTKQAKQQKIVIGHPTVLIDLAKSVSVCPNVTKAVVRMGF